MFYISRGTTYFDFANQCEDSDQKQESLNLAITDFTTGLDLPNLDSGTKAELLINRGAAKAAGNPKDTALDDLNEGLRLDPENLNGYLNRSLMYWEMQKYDDVIEDYSSYLALNPNNASIWYERGMLRRSLGQPQAALDDLNQAIKLNPKFGIAYLERARAHALLGNKQAALADYQHAELLGHQMEDYDKSLMKK